MHGFPAARSKPAYCQLITASDPCLLVKTSRATSILSRNDWTNLLSPHGERSLNPEPFAVPPGECGMSLMGANPLVLLTSRGCWTRDIVSGNSSASISYVHDWISREGSCCRHHVTLEYGYERTAMSSIDGLVLRLYKPASASWSLRNCN